MEIETMKSTDVFHLENTSITYNYLPSLFTGHTFALCSSSESDLRVLSVKDCVVLANENVSENVEFP